MKAAKFNPSTNNLPSGLSDSDVELAITKSGYPLQAVVGNMLRKEFGCAEEWSYIDRDTKELRTIDLLATRYLYELATKHPRVRPELDLLIECKQSELPYIFFLTPAAPYTPWYPMISGLFRRSIILKTNGSLSTWNLPIRTVMDMENEPFVCSPPATSLSLSKCVRNSKAVVLSGSDAYRGLILPIVKAMNYFDLAERPPDTAKYFDCHLLFGVGVIDGPMIGVRVENSQHECELVPWVRVFRRESYESKDWTERSKIFAIDIVHKDYLEIFLNDHLKPFVEKFSTLLMKHQTVIAKGKGYIKDLEIDSFRNLEERLRNS